ncbi:uncharacterized protein SCODWIG_03467 [Saccharomycodes ludwigii]|uniref:MARVEL domain-containing protein n=1 Tax=Saccharomycodes ludwigii TaxID=36035 RepID=A0A376BAM5_9ASCO|nr:uncharacterized protein SCODWIG_03467 [Saccharomycodes ludwigii]
MTTYNNNNNNNNNNAYDVDDANNEAEFGRNTYVQETPHGTYATNNNAEQQQNQEKKCFKEKCLNVFKEYIPLTLLRFFQFASSVITLGLTCYTIHAYGRHDSKTNFGIATSAISCFYLIALILILMFARKWVMPGVFFLCEIIVTILWLCAFVVLAKQHGRYSCSSTYNSSNNLYYNSYLGQYVNSTYSRPCKSSKASIAFAGLSFVLFCVSSFLFWYNIIRPIMNNFKGYKDVWKNSGEIGVSMRRLSGLTLVNREYYKTQPDFGANDKNNNDNEGDLENGNYNIQDNTTNVNRQQNTGRAYGNHSRQLSGASSSINDVILEKENQYSEGNYAANNPNSVEVDKNVAVPASHQPDIPNTATTTTTTTNVQQQDTRNINLPPNP